MIFYCVLPLYQINATAVIPRCYAERNALETNLVHAARAACTVVISRFLCCALQMVGKNKTEKKTVTVRRAQSTSLFHMDVGF